MKRLLIITIFTSIFCEIKAQSEILQIIFKDGNITTLKVDDIKEMRFETEGHIDTVVYKEYSGYTIANSKYFKDLYSGGTSTLTVCKTGNEWVVKYNDPTWGEGLFGNVKVGAELNGEGYLDIAYQGAPVKRYAANIGGTMTCPEINIPEIMNGCTLKFISGNPSEALSYAGSYKGINSVVVGGSFTYAAKIEYKITANSDGTINIDVPQYSLAGTIMGNLELGKYTISNIAYDRDKEAFYRAYGNDGIKQHMVAETDGNRTMDGDYELKGNSNILIKKKGDIITIVNSFTLGAMPFPIVATFTNSVNE
ncbi:MAG: calycin-like domain-containing protein, partial [Muribaculaceae bacterium]|nr:calycin-like domain-containing protein [Muribaculaceae bacterium]